MTRPPDHAASTAAPGATRWAVLLLLAFWAALAFAVVMALLPHPPSIPHEPSDKVQHMAAFITMTVLACAAFPRASLLRIGERLSFLGALIEVAQSLPVLHRDCDLWDWVADTAAIAAVLLVVSIARRGRG